MTPPVYPPWGLIGSTDRCKPLPDKELRRFGRGIRGPPSPYYLWPTADSGGPGATSVPVEAGTGE